ncbi:mechanosensitive ion channel domain-containing protein [Microbacterium caowuchunii]|uniref:Mechanosensitive ion channel n=1 Tax=Microbacterium caowuchunii TaxID=2614638 RepID=A0A5N0TM93_9MICO|nr:mechanosensitive ion channel domain-containing protein [Microbacterium caowuchunii]KAA9135036.1 mechanosensitive ion channel [Microbacterium caowuchunii]
MIRFEGSDNDTPVNPEFWVNAGEFFLGVGGTLLAVLGIIAGALVAVWILKRVIHRIVERIVSGAKSKAQVTDTQALDRSPLAAVRLVQRTRTLGSILQNIASVTIVIVALILIVNVIDPSILGSFALLTAAIGAGLGFGAQNIVKDVLNGIFIVAEDQVGIGDVVDLGLATGVVEYVSVRVTHVRDVNGTLWYVRNGEITRIGNMSQGWSRVIIDLAVPSDVDIHAVEKGMLDAARALAKDPKWRSRILEQPELWGLESVSGDALVIRLVQRTRSNAKDDVARELRMRLKRAMDAMDVRLPQLNSIVLSGTEGAQRVRGANPPVTNPTTLPIERPVWKPKRTARKLAKARQTASDEPPVRKPPERPRKDTATALKDAKAAREASRPVPDRDAAETSPHDAPKTRPASGADERPTKKKDAEDGS